jgi:hypothetical protein
LADVTITDWITAVVAVCALILSVRNTWVQHRDRTPRIEMRTYWLHPVDAPMALRGTANPVAPAGKATYRCEVTNVGVAGVKITLVTIYNPQAPPGKPVPLHLPDGEEPRRLETGDSQTWSVTISASLEPNIVEQKYPPDPRFKNSVVATDTVGKRYTAKDPARYPYRNYMLHLGNTGDERGPGRIRRALWRARSFIGGRG